MKPVDDWRSVHKWFSTYGIIALGLLPTVYENIGFLQDFIPPNIFRYLLGALGAATLGVRMIKQK